MATVSVRSVLRSGGGGRPNKCMGRYRPSQAGFNPSFESHPVARGRVSASPSRFCPLMQVNIAVGAVRTMSLSRNEKGDMAVELFANDAHRCIAFPDMVRGDDGVQANQFLVMDGSESALIDPGGALLYTPLSLALSGYLKLRDLTYICASHQDPDVIGSVDRWLMYTPARVVCSRLWGRFIPHSVPHYQKNTSHDRYILIEDAGGLIALGRSHLRAVPAHFLHSVGNLQFYDPVSRILFSGDLGASVGVMEYKPVADFDAHVPKMLSFHRRYMASNRACRWWARRARQLDIAMIAPQHGIPMVGADVGRFIDWIEDLECGVDLLPVDEVVDLLPAEAAGFN